MKMKNIILLLIFLLSGIYVSCNMEEKPYTSLPIDAYFETPEQFGYYLNGVYSLLVTGNTWGGAAIATTLFDDDDTQASNTYRPGTDGKYDMINRTADGWRGFYTIVQQANTFLYALDKKGDILTPDLRKRYRGEALFLRAHAFMELVRRFGPIPLRVEPYIEGVSSQDMARSEQTIVYTQIVNDLKEASQYLPVNYNGSYASDKDRGRPTKQAAFGLMMKAYLHLAGAEAYGVGAKTSDPAKVVDCYKEVVDAGDSIFHWASITGFPALEQKYMDIFDPKTQNKCNEILFVAQTLTNTAGKGVEIAFTLCPPVSGWSGTDGSGGGQVTLRWDFVGKKFYGNDKRVEWGKALADSFYNAKSSEQRWYYVYCPYVRPTTTEQSGPMPLGWVYNDQNKWNSTYAVPSIPKNDHTGYGYDKTIDVKWNNAGSSRKATPKIYSLKYTDPEANGKLENGSDIILLRYADVLLMYAEAKNELNDVSEAISKLDDVRKRAGIPLIKDVYSGISQGELRDSIRLERRRELYLEFNRRWDLIRWGKFATTMTEAKRPREEWQNLYPIPVQEITANGLINSNNEGW